MSNSIKKQHMEERQQRMVNTTKLDDHIFFLQEEYIILPIYRFTQKCIFPSVPLK